MPGTAWSRGAKIPRGAVAVTPSDSTDLRSGVVGLYVGVGGNISVDMWGEGESVVLVGVVTGSVIDGNFRRVNSTGTTATNIVAFYDV